MSEETLAFIYRDAKGNITFREVTNISESDIYIQAICLTAGELRTFRQDRILERVSGSVNVEERLEYFRNKLPPPEPVAHNNWKRNETGALEVCFTGFKAQDKEELIRLAESHGLIVRANVTSQLNILCGGYNAGPAKTEKARHQGVMVLSEHQFRGLVETGEVPLELSSVS
jgi:NAD-dependent DNA ligase